MPRPASPPPRLLSAAAKAAQDGWRVTMRWKDDPPITVAVDEGGENRAPLPKGGGDDEWEERARKIRSS